MSNKVQTILQTTALTSGVKGKKTVFLGVWCKEYKNAKTYYKGQKTLPYHWDDRRKLKRDYDYLQLLNKQLISELSDALNKLHGVNRSKHYWNLLLGYWLNLYTAVLYDRWTMILAGNESKFIDCIETNDWDPSEISVNSLHDFQTAIFDDYWNVCVFSLISERIATVPLVKGHFKNPNIKRTGESKSKEIFKKILNGLSFFFGKNDKHFFIGSYIPKWVEFALLKTFRSWHKVNLPFFSYDKNYRQRLLVCDDDKDGFECLVREVIHLFLPRMALEGFHLLDKISQNIKWPKNPKTIFTSSNHLHDDIFNAWAGGKCDAGARLIIGEHGGMGIGKFNGTVDFQIDVSDNFLSTGWTLHRKKVTPVGNFRQLGKTQKSNKNGSILMVCNAMPKYSVDIRSMVITGQMESYFEDQFRFTGLLHPQVKDILMVRLSVDDYGWNQKQRWKDRRPNIRLDKLNRPMLKVLKDCRLLVATYNGTPFVESIMLNFPTIIFWDLSLWEINKLAEPCFEQLMDAGIFHDSIESAANHINTIWNDVDQWWSLDSTVMARNRFCSEYSNISPNTFLKLKQAVLN